MGGGRRPLPRQAARLECSFINLVEGGRGLSGLVKEEQGPPEVGACSLSPPRTGPYKVQYSIVATVDYSVPTYLGT